MGKEITFKDNNTVLRAKWFEPENAKEQYPVVLLATGDGPKGSGGQTWATIPKMLNEKGIAAFLFDFAGLGKSDGMRKELTISTGISNFKAALRQIGKHTGHAPKSVGVFAASFGGNAALLACATEPDIKAIALKSPCCYLPEAFICEFGHDLVNKWANTGFLEQIGFNYDSFIDSLRYSTYEAATKIDATVMVAHGEADTIIPFRQSQDLMHYLKEGDLVGIPGADHWYAEGDQWQQMATTLVDFLANEL